MEPFHQFIHETSEQNPNAAITKPPLWPAIEPAAIKSAGNDVDVFGIRLTQSADQGVHNQDSRSIRKRFLQFSIE
jgi:hypothetical protein